MDFHSLGYLLYFLSVTVLFFALPHGWRTLFLLAVSSFFYANYIPIYLSVLYAIAVLDFWGGQWIERSRGRARKLALGVSLCANIGLLAYFKYCNFLIDNWNQLGLWPIDWRNSWALPIGLSFHTFQAMSYTIEVYRGNVAAERSFWHYALYVMFFPQLVAGPIERPQRLLPQLHARHGLDADRILAGIVQMGWGYFKKVVIADRLAPIVDVVYSHPQNFTGMPLLFATVAFALQIYCDFSGYSDIALGSARVLGIKLMTNFRRPYLAESVADFWRRWHISLSSWFRDYVYLPLGGSRNGTGLWARNVLLTFLLSGLWHGASWTFVAWGGLNGLLLLAERALPKLRLALAWRRLVTFLAILATWVFFRAHTFADATWVFAHFLDDPSSSLQRAWLSRMGQTLFDWHVLAFSLAALLWVELREERSQQSLPEWLVGLPGWRRWLALYVLFACIMVLGKMNSSQQFIYFQF